MREIVTCDFTLNGHIMEMINNLKWNWDGHVREEQITVGQPALRFGRPGDTQGTEEDQGRVRGTTKIAY